MKVDELSELLLTGYVNHFSNGFTLPCYSTAPKSNTWYLASCSVDGDHRGVITGFSPFISNDIVSLNESKIRRAEIKSPWLNVLAWEGDAIVGTTKDIWRKTETLHAAIAKKAPLTLLDLQVGLRISDVISTLNTASEFLSKRYGDEKQLYWKINSLIKPQVIITLRRFVYNFGGGGGLYSDAKNVKITLNGRNLIATMPDAILAFLGNIDKTEATFLELEFFAQSLGLMLSRPDYESASHPKYNAANISIIAGSKNWQKWFELASKLAKKGRASNSVLALQEAIGLFRNEVIPRAPRRVRPLDWASSQNGLGTALRFLGNQLGDSEILDSALLAYRDALLERRRDNHPFLWAAVTNNIGVTFAIKGEAGDASLVKEAISHFENSLLEFTRGKKPLEWAGAQSNLGRAHLILARMGDHKAASAAIEAYENVLLERPRDKLPLSWAAAQNNIGTAYKISGETKDDVDLLKKAKLAYETALLERTHSRAPLQWAATQSNLGSVLKLLGDFGDENALISAIQCYKNALLVRTRDTTPFLWAATHHNLGNAFSALGRKRGEAYLHRAVEAYETALTERTREKLPLKWAMTQNGLGNAFRLIAEMGDHEASIKSVMHIERALLERTRKNDPTRWAHTQNDLAIALVVLSDFNDTSASSRAFEAFASALEVFTTQNSPLEWAKTTLNLAIWEANRGDKLGDKNLLLASLKRIEEAIPLLSNKYISDGKKLASLLRANLLAAC
ncbi:MAG: Tetratricopeptide domain protein [Rubritepida sp.]|nr:Tetratricopeptide domain protein [Rubritepida sp.]